MENCQLILIALALRSWNKANTFHTASLSDITSECKRT
jgi:hypothetical protein